MENVLVQQEVDLTSAFERQVAPHVAGLRVYARRLARDRDDAEDLVQECLLRAFRSFRRFRGDCSLKTWLCVIARNLWRDAVRRRASRPALEPLACPDRLPASELAPCPFERIEALVAGQLECFTERTTRVLLGLPRDARAALLLASVGGLTHREIADVLGWSNAEVRLRLSTTRQRLQRRLAGRPRGPERAARPDRRLPSRAAPC